MTFFCNGDYLANNPPRITSLARDLGLEVEQIRLLCTSPVMNMVPPLLVVELI